MNGQLSKIRLVHMHMYGVRQIHVFAGQCKSKLFLEKNLVKTCSPFNNGSFGTFCIQLVKSQVSVSMNIRENSTMDWIAMDSSRTQFCSSLLTNLDAKGRKEALLNGPQVFYKMFFLRECQSAKTSVMQYFGCFILVGSVIIFFVFRFVGTVGSHEKSYPVEKMDISHDGSLVASISHDECVKFWNIKYLEVSVLTDVILHHLQSQQAQMRN